MTASSACALRISHGPWLPTVPASLALSYPRSLPPHTRRRPKMTCSRSAIPMAVSLPHPPLSLASACLNGLRPRMSLAFPPQWRWVRGFWLGDLLRLERRAADGRGSDVDSRFDEGAIAAFSVWARGAEHLRWGPRQWCRQSRDEHRGTAGGVDG